MGNRVRNTGQPRKDVGFSALVLLQTINHEQQRRQRIRGFDLHFSDKYSYLKCNEHTRDIDAGDTCDFNSFRLGRHTGYEYRNDNNGNKSETESKDCAIKKSARAHRHDNYASNNYNKPNRCSG